MVPLKPGVAAGLAQLSRLLKPAIEYLWVDMVWRKNDDLFKEALNIKGHLFGRQRLPLGRVGILLKEEFGANCFYCKIATDRRSSRPCAALVDHPNRWDRESCCGMRQMQ